MCGSELLWQTEIQGKPWIASAPALPSAEGGQCSPKPTKLLNRDHACAHNAEKPEI